MSGGVQSEALYFFRNALSKTGQDLPDLEMQWLASQGFTQGDLNYRWYQYYKAGNTLPPILQALLTTPLMPKTSGPDQINFSSSIFVWNGISYASLALLLAANSGTFSRASTGYDLAGTTNFSINTPRVTSAGLLIEPAGTNLGLMSATLDDVAWSKSGLTVTADSAVAPDGTTTLDKLVEGSALGTHQIVKAATATVIASQPVTISAYLKAGERSAILLCPYSGAAGTYFNLANGTVTSNAGTTSSIQSVGNGFYRCLATLASAPSTTASPQIYMTNPSGTVSYQGDGTSGEFMWGVQLEQGPIASSYIPTTSTSASRATDVMTISVPRGRSQAIVTFNDGTTKVTAVTGGSTFDVVAAVSAYITSNSVVKPISSITLS